MSHLSIKRRNLGLLILTPLIASLACQATGAPATGPTTLAPTSPGSPTAELNTGTTPQSATPGLDPTLPAAADPGAPGEASAVGEVVLGPGPFDLSDPAVGLGDLAGYRATLSLSFEGTEAGQPSLWSRTYDLVSTRAPLARQLTIESVGQLADVGTVEQVELRGTTYEARGDTPCTVAATDPALAPVDALEPAAMLTGLIGVDEAGDETINGRTAHHYTFDERALGLVDLADASGEVWVAAEGGYLLNYALVMTAGPEYFGDGIQGTATWAYALTDIDLPATIALPADCPAGLIDAPMLPDATDIEQVPGLTRYASALSPIAAADFYRQQLPELGWELAQEPPVTETVALLDFTRGNQHLMVLLTAEATGTTALLVLEPVTP